MERQSLTSEQMTQIQQIKQPLEQAKLYAKYGIWTEAVEILITQKNSQPQEGWKQLLQSVQLAEVTNTPIVEIETDK